ncbi:MAG TPA: sigma-54 dependent transcriptional regulator [Pyrinomonadaceae bacterium]|nr:sigma-54 dependent transcriptional regulator [Pyrinomonadaceae bacterium]HEU4837664.1 sigma-54 dependent transcriptional regulator [Pyrinomonadaceae bacterium]
MNQRQRKTILVVDDDLSVTDSLRLLLTDAGFQVLTANSFTAARAIFREAQFDLVITDLCLPDGTGIDVITHVKTEAPETEVILMTGHGSLDITIEAIKRGAYYYVEKPCTPDTLYTLINRALEVATLKRENESLKRTLSGGGEAFGMIGRHPKLHQIIQTIRTTAPSDASVLIEGESGTGKELVAAAFHAQSLRSSAGFIRINCSAIPHELIESELFGYKKGAFTGADHDKRGLIEAANGGTLLLDEIAEMPAHLQTKLLRVLQERKLRRVGDEREIDVSFRLLSATNRNTAALLEQGLLRNDLYFRISTIKIQVPPLRERLDDVPLIARHFLDRFNVQYNKKIRDLSPATVQRLLRYNWPGNIRELESVIERAVLFCSGKQLDPDCLPEEFHRPRLNNSSFVIPPLVPMEEIEREAILQTLERTSGNVRRSAQILRFPRPTFYRKLKKLGITVERGA